MVVVNASISPFMAAEDAWLSLVCLVQLCTTLFVGLLVKADILHTHGAAAEGLAGLVVFLNVGLLFAPLFMILWHFSNASEGVLAILLLC